MNHSGAAGGGLDARAYTPPVRLAAGTLAAVAGASLCLISTGVLLGSPLTADPSGVMLLVLLLAAVPWGAAWALGRAAASTVDVEDGMLVIRPGGLRVEVPVGAITGLMPWRIPLPDPGLTIQLRSGTRLRWRLALPDPMPLLDTLAASGVEPAHAAAHHPIVVWAHARRTTRRARRWYHYAGKFVVFAALPAAILFNVHQHIVFGGTLGQYYMYGLEPYLQSVAFHWAATTTYLVLWAAVLRGVAEGASLLLAALAPAHAAPVRRVVEMGCAAGYYGGVPALLALRLMA